MFSPGETVAFPKGIFTPPPPHFTAMSVVKLELQEAHLLMSALSVAASSSGFQLPCFLPVHDGMRDSHWGFALAPGGTTRHFEVDSVHISNPPRHLLAVPLVPPSRTPCNIVQYWSHPCPAPFFPCPSGNPRP